MDHDTSRLIEYAVSLVLIGLYTWFIYHALDNIAKCVQ